MWRAGTVLVALALVMTGCAGDSAEEIAAPTSAPATTSTTEAATTTTEPTTTTTTPSETPTTTTKVPTTTTTETPAGVNSPAVEAYWCETFEEVDAFRKWTPDEFVAAFIEALETGQTNAPVETLEEAAAQLELVECGDGYGQEIAEVMNR